MNLRWHYFLPQSIANGPGKRSVLWLQGCALGCPGCCNPGLQPLSGGKLASVDSIFEMIRHAAPLVDGITISGGEPFLQAEALFLLLQRLRTETDLSVFVYSGYTREFLSANPETSRCLPLIDAILCGPYLQQLETPAGDFRPSENQQLWLLSDRFTTEDFSNLPMFEFFIAENGDLIQTGAVRKEIS